MASPGGNSRSRRPNKRPNSPAAATVGGKRRRPGTPSAAAAAPPEAPEAAAVSQSPAAATSAPEATPDKQFVFKDQNFVHSGKGGVSAGKKTKTWKNLKQILAMERILPWKPDDPTFFTSCRALLVAVKPMIKSMHAAIALTLVALLVGWAQGNEVCLARMCPDGIPEGASQFVDDDNCIEITCIDAQGPIMTRIDHANGCPFSYGCLTYARIPGQCCPYCEYWHSPPVDPEGIVVQDDVNECSSNNGGCDHYCDDTVGSYYCSCRPGYQLAGSSRCVDINECFTDNGGCDHICVNTAGSYRCTCRVGYHLSGSKNCFDIDECCSNNGGCSHNCVNTAGSYHCT
ncbi:SCUBE3 [Branchiostoma lanceolatum]|uniref:SCUBE3 protein n=1 Tax=Branchiostoma lanceolatum TaxID=7740 RepID=A0A8J9YLX4_BRALA|nr:SCUBE3 [Branchiostoma lanceolatum]